MRPTGADVSLTWPSAHDAKSEDPAKQRKAREIKRQSVVRVLKVPTRLPEDPFKNRGHSPFPAMEAEKENVPYF
jgi:hypothetical protein